MTLSKPNYIPKAPLPNIITLGFRVSLYEFWWGHKHSVHDTVSIQPLHPSQPLSPLSSGCRHCGVERSHPHCALSDLLTRSICEHNKMVVFSVYI